MSTGRAMSVKLRVRMAPSPTGDIHVGSARTALINFLVARGGGGAFVLRIEDTDAERSDPAKEAGICEALRWLGLHWDEGPDTGGAYGPYRQSERREFHSEAIASLLAGGMAYEDFTTASERAAEREEHQRSGQTPRYSGRGRYFTRAEIAERRAAGVVPAVRFKTEPGDLAFQDTVFGPLSVQTSDIEDFVIARGNGSALYNLANTVDDHGMSITHVLRGMDHLPNTFRQLLLYRALGWEAPRFAHLPLVVSGRRQKLSKRDGAQWVGEFRDLGYLPEAVVNFLIFLGWAPGDEREIFSLDDLIRDFSLARVNRADAVFDSQKLDYFNGVWIRRLDITALAARARPFAEDGGIELSPQRYPQFQAALALEHERLRHLTDVPDMMSFFLADELDPDMTLLKFNKHDPAAIDAALARVESIVRELDDFTAAQLEPRLRGLADELGWKTGDLFMPIRVAVTGRRATPPLFDTMAVVGRERCLRRLACALVNLKALAAA